MTAADRAWSRRQVLAGLGAGGARMMGVIDTEGP